MQKLTAKKLIILSGISLILGVIFFNTKDLLFGAPLSIETAIDGGTVSNYFLPISGKTKHASILKINGRVVMVDKNGVFSDGALLSPGYNIIEIKMNDRFGKEKREVFHLVAEQSASVATVQSIHYQ
jgi:hypothetical protein